MSSAVIDSQPQFVLIHEGRVCHTRSGSLDELRAEAAAVAASLGVSVAELVAQYRVMVTTTSPWAEVGEPVDWDEVRSAWREWTPPGEDTAGL